MLCLGDSKFGCGGFGIYFPLWVVFMVPLPVFALILERKSTQRVPLRLAVYLGLILATLEFIWLSRFGTDDLWQLLVMLVLGSSAIIAARLALPPKPDGNLG